MSSPFASSRHRQGGGALARFKAPKPKAGSYIEPSDDSDVMVLGATIYPSTVVPALESPRLLVSGRNNPKTGFRVEKGMWAGMPIYTLTLEERASCPSYCHMLRGCYGNSMHLARRHRLGLDFEMRLAGELREMADARPQGFVVRLHILGDFYRAAYVELWRRMLSDLPLLHVFGYSRRESGGPDGDIFTLLEGVKQDFPTRFRVRWSRSTPVPDGTVVLGHGEPVPKSVTLCPAQVEATATCGTCGLCWAPGKVVPTIGFLRHGRRHEDITGRRGKRTAARLEDA